MRILFLYSELADYTLSCLRALKSAERDADILVIYSPVNKEAPFVFDYSGIGEFECVSSFKSFGDFKQRIVSFQPDMVVCSGWIVKWYLNVCSRLPRSCVRILASDNVWQGTVKQVLLSGVSRFTIRRIFQKIWIPGDPQFHYARQLGYSRKDILTGFYSCDVGRFNATYQLTIEDKRKKFPHRFLCVARYIPLKGYNQLWSAFIEWKEARSNDWELWCAGTGAGYEQRIEHKSIKHIGFVNREGWENVVQNTGVFVLASLYEPWGVAVHEFAAAGYPLLLSRNVGAGSAFLDDDNGYWFDPANKQDLISVFDAIANKTDEELVSMAQKSSEYSQRITPQQWAGTLLRVSNEH